MKGEIKKGKTERNKETEMRKARYGEEGIEKRPLSLDRAL